ncbi:glycosyltransferase involved in cell wall biosynthesis [Bradyrhizobium sp. AZCC 1610]|uniref:glycosyltransferase family 4 protein n=1 Tax=Bradyrhizobium sp. AZCC 1610 TaxID=3117020 RepID=UPI002FF26675
MRVALVSFHYAEYASRLALALDRYHEVLLILDSSNAQYDLSKSLRNALVRRGNALWFGQQRRRSALFHVIRLTHEMRRFRPDVIHVQEVASRVPTWANDVLRYSIPLVVTVHDPVPHSGADRRWAEKSEGYRARLRTRADRLIVHGERVREEWRGREPELTFRLASVPHGVLGDDQGWVETIPEKPPVFLFFGRIEVYKGLEYALQAAELLALRGLQFRLVVAGTGTELDRHRAKIDQMPWVELMDRRFLADEIPQLFRRASAVVLPYTDATQSGVAAMAFGFGRPVIATCVGGLPDVVTNEHNGLLVAPKSVGALADAMGRFILSEKLDERLRRGATERARGELSWEVIARETSAVYEDAIRFHG